MLVLFVGGAFDIYGTRCFVSPETTVGGPRASTMSFTCRYVCMTLGNAGRWCVCLSHQVLRGMSDAIPILPVIAGIVPVAFWGSGL